MSRRASLLSGAIGAHSVGCRCPLCSRRAPRTRLARLATRAATAALAGGAILLAVLWFAFSVFGRAR